MTGDKNKFTSLTLKDGGNVKFGDNSKGKIIGIGNISKTHSLVIEDVLSVVGLKHNLLSISQLCDKGYNVIFKSIMCIIINKLIIKFYLWHLEMKMSTLLILII